MLRRWSLLCLSAIECVFCTGVMFGASSLFALMRKDGQYSELCASAENDTDYTTTTTTTTTTTSTTTTTNATANDSNNNDNNNSTFTNAIVKCASANVKYSQIYTIGALGTQVSVFVWGILLDKFGVLPCRLMSLLIFAAGCVLFAESDSEHFDAFIAASGLLSIGGAGFSLSHYTFCSHWDSTRYFEITHAIMNTAYDASTLSFLIFMLLHQSDAEIFSMRHLFYTLFVISVLFLVLSHKRVWGKYMERPEEIVLESGARQLKNIGSMKRLGFSSSSYFDRKIGRSAATHNGRIINEMTFLEQLKTPHYLWLSLWSFFCIYRIMFLLGSVFEHLLLAGDGRDYEDANTLVLLFNGLILTCIPIFGVMGSFINKFGLAISITVVNLLGIISFIPILSNDSYWSLCIGFIAFGIFRSSFYTTITVYCQHVFGPGMFGKMFGIGVGVWAILSAVLQYPTMEFALKSESPKKAFFIIDLFLIACSVFLFVMPIWLHLTKKVRKREFDRLRHLKNADAGSATKQQEQQGGQKNISSTGDDNEDDEDGDDGNPNGNPNGDDVVET